MKTIIKNRIKRLCLVAMFSGEIMVDALLAQSPAPTDYAILPVSFTHVKLQDTFWKNRLEVSEKITIPYVLEKCRTEGRIDNFLKAAGRIKADRMTDFPFDDTDLYKLLEGISYSLMLHPDPALKARMDELIAIIGAAQEKDGYLYTFRTAHPTHPQEWIGNDRWVKEEDLSHELYDAGHLYEAATANFEATGDRVFLNIAIKNADLLCRDFGWDKLRIYPGHEIVEMGLVKLYRVTKNLKYLNLAKFFLDVRGPRPGSLSQEYSQSDRPILEQHEAEGHAVRAAYLYSGIADVAALKQDKSYLKTIDEIWNDVVSHKIYITGGIGATGNGESFGKSYDLPNMSAYCETCASIANIYWNERMFLLHGDACYIDVLERTLYNSLLSGVSLSGDHFFYPNPLASFGQNNRSGWFSCACCISNIARFMPSMPEYIYGQSGENIYVNLFVSNHLKLNLPTGIPLDIEQKTGYPWDGNVRISLNPKQTVRFALHVRIPGWLKNQPIPSDLYHFYDAADKQSEPSFVLNGKKIRISIVKGYAVIDRKWKKGDVLQFNFNMPIRKVLANDSVLADKGRFAFQRGPIVYCLEGRDQQDSSVLNLVVDKHNQFKEVYRPDILDGIVELQGHGVSLSRIAENQLKSQIVPVRAVPYCVWDNRGPGEMEVWIPFNNAEAHAKAMPTIASLSKVSSSRHWPLMEKSLNDQFLPQRSADQSQNYLHWWPNTAKEEWVMYTFDKPYLISQSGVYWYDDGPWGGCRVPDSWSLFYLSMDDKWLPCENRDSYGKEKDKMNIVHFTPIMAKGLKLILKLPEKNSSGIHEWTVQ